MRKSIEPTYDSRETGPRFNIETRINGQAVNRTQISDPFIRHTVRLAFWDAVKAYIFTRRLHIDVLVSGDSQIIEDVLELDADYLGPNSTRRHHFNAQVNSALENM